MGRGGPTKGHEDAAGAGWVFSPVLRRVFNRAVWFSVCALACAAAQTPKEKAPPEQPIPFSHKQHAADLKLPCKMCHANPPPGELMRIAAASVCMQCHSAIKTGSPAIQKLAEAARNGREIRWVRVYQIPSYVNFAHKSHLDAGNQCQECHGQVAQRDKLSREGDISMGGCMNCHQAKKVSIDCGFCHEPR